MSRIRAIAWKDLRSTMRNVPALAMMLLAPLVLAALLGFAFGGGQSQRRQQHHGQRRHVAHRAAQVLPGDGDDAAHGRPIVGCSFGPPDDDPAAAVIPSKPCR